MIGHGTSASVYRQNGLAIKKFDREDDDNSYCNFISKVQVMKMCCHKNVMRYEGVIIDSSTKTYGILMQGGIGHLNRQTVDCWKFDIRDIMKQVAMGLYHLECNDILNLDIKPENIIYTKMELPK